MNQKDIKLLWGRSANRCSICKIVLSQDKAAVSSSFTLGEQAHIVGEQVDAPRGKSPLTSDERNSYHNIILLCPNHHTEIDKNFDDWPIERLHRVKSEHELWAEETLNATEDKKTFAENAIVKSIVDDAVSNCQFQSWRDWTSFALAPDPSWQVSMINQIASFRRKVMAGVWPADYHEFKRAAQTLSMLLNAAANKFLEHADQKQDAYFAIRFYKIQYPNPQYDKDIVRFQQWQDECYDLIYKATMAANWFADVVRRDVDPMFFAKEGKFLIEEGPFEELDYRTRLIEFTDEEKSGLPAALKAN